MSSTIDLVRAPHRGLDPAAILQRPVSILLGVSQAAHDLLGQVGISTVLDLASSVLFANAREICLLAENGQGRFSAIGRVPKDMLRSGNELSLPELVSAPISTLASSVSSAKMDELADALDVNSVYELGIWPPYRTACELFNRVYNPMAGPGIFDPGTPSDLLPANGQYPTERVQYEVLLFDEFVEKSNPKPLPMPGYGGRIFGTTPPYAEPLHTLGDDGPLDVTRYLSDSVGYERPAIGGLLTFTQSWYTKGLSLGHLIHGIALGPGETTKIAMIDWARRVLTSATEGIGETEQLFSDLSRARSLGEITRAVAQETQEGRSAARSEASATQRGEAAGAAQLRDPGFSQGSFTSPGVSTSGSSFGSSIGSSEATSWSTSSGQREIGASLAQDIVDRTHQEAHSARNRRASIVREVSQQESESISTRTLTNYNHMHSLTIEYYEVVQLYRTVVELSKADRCIFIPMKLVDFRNLNLIDRYRTALAGAALSPIVREVLDLPAATTRIQAPAIQTAQLSVAETNSSSIENLPQDRWIAQDIYSAQAASGGQIRVLSDGRLALPSDAVLSNIDFVVRKAAPKPDATPADTFFVGSTTVTVRGSNEPRTGLRIQKGSRVHITGAGRITFGSLATEGSFFTGNTPVVFDPRAGSGEKDTGLRIRKGSRVHVTASGKVWFNPNDAGDGYDANGGVPSKAAGIESYAPRLIEFSLVCRVGTNWYQGGTADNPNNIAFFPNEDGNLILQANSPRHWNINDRRGEWDVTVQVSPPPGVSTQTTFDPNGKDQPAGTEFNAPGRRAFSLICRVGTTWHQGGTDEELVADADGELLLQANDIIGGPGGNTGSWEVTLEVSAPVESSQNTTAPSLIITRRDGSVVTTSVSAGGVPLGNSSVRVDNINNVAIAMPDVRSDQIGFLAATFQLQGRQFRLVFPVRLGTGTTATIFYTEIPSDLVSHFMDNKIYYSQVIWRSLNPATIGIMLSGYSWQIGGRARPLVEIVDPRPVAIVANYLVLRISGDDAAEYNEWLDRKRIRLGSWREDQIPVPTGGVFAEAVLGRSNSAEKLDITRFWDWQESPLPVQAPDIAAIQAGSRRDIDTTVPSQLGQPVLNIVNPPALPDPQGMGAILTAIQNGNMFRDMSGLAATIGLAQAALAGANQGAEAAAAQAGTNAAVAAELGAKVAEIAGKIVAAYLSGGASLGAGGGGSSGGLINAAKGNSKSGQVLNYARDMDNRGVPPGGGNGTSPAFDQANSNVSGNGAQVNTATGSTASVPGTWEGEVMNASLGEGGGGGAVGQFLKTILGGTPSGVTSLSVPGIRWCCQLGFNSGIEPADVRGHKYGSTSTSNCGYIYTEKAGLLDIGHIRDHIDLTKYVYDAILAGQKTIPCREGTAALLQSPSDPIAAAQAIAYVDSWSHELISFGGNQDFSAFAPEDLPSNFLGTHIGAKALGMSGSGGSFDATVDTLLSGLLASLGARSEAETNRVIQDLKGNWWDTNWGVPRLLRRNFESKPWFARTAFDKPPAPAFIDASPLTSVFTSFDYTSEPLADGTIAKLSDFPVITDKMRSTFRVAGTDRP
jgi:hypothetical protein